MTERLWKQLSNANEDERSLLRLRILPRHMWDVRFQEWLPRVLCSWILSSGCQSSEAAGLAAFVEAENLWERDKDAEKNDKKSGQCSKPVETAEIARIGGITGIKEAC